MKNSNGKSRSKKPHAANDKAATDDPVEPWWENVSYEGFLKLANTTFRPDLFHLLSGNEFKLLAYLTFLRWRFSEANGCLRLGHDYLVRGTGLSQGTVRRCMRSLARKECLKNLGGRWIGKNRSTVNGYRIYSILLLDTPDQIDRDLLSSPDQIDRTPRSNRSRPEGTVGTPRDHFDHQDQIQTLQRDGAPRQRPNTSAGGDEGKVNGGLGLSAESFPGNALAELHAKLDSLGAKPGKRPVGNGARARTVPQLDGDGPKPLEGAMPA